MKTPIGDSATVKGIRCTYWLSRIFGTPFVNDHVRSTRDSNVFTGVCYSVQVKGREGRRSMGQMGQPRLEEGPVEGTGRKDDPPLATSGLA